MAGTILVLVFSDPMVDILSDLGKRVGVPAFYVSFVLAPVASNASELVAALAYAKKKTRGSIATSIDQCFGAASMNNTFGLGIFLGLIYFKGMIWEFSAETIAILFCEICIGLVAFKKLQTTLSGFVVLMFYVGCIAIVALLENVVGLN